MLHGLVAKAEGFAEGPAPDACRAALAEYLPAIAKNLSTLQDASRKALRMCQPHYKLNDKWRPLRPWAGETRFAPYAEIVSGGAVRSHRSIPYFFRFREIVTVSYRSSL